MMTGNDREGKAREPGPRWRRWLVRDILLTLAIFVVAALLYPLFARRHDGPSPTGNCLSNVKNLAMAINMYVTDYDAPPEPGQWCDQLEEYVKSREVYKCPEAPGLACGYALNLGVRGASPGNLAAGAAGAKTVTIFESDAGWNAHGGGSLLPETPRHLGGDNYGFLEGSARWVKREEAGRLRWGVKGEQ